MDALKAKQSKMDDLRKRRQNLRQNQIEVMHLNFEIISFDTNINIVLINCQYHKKTNFQKVESTFDELFRDLDEVRQAVRKELARCDPQIVYRDHSTIIKIFY